MKSNLLSLTLAALLCCTPFTASARDTGASVAAQFDLPIVPAKFMFKPIPSGKLSFGLESASADECQWQVLNIPVRIGALKIKNKQGDKVTPNYVPAITFTVHLCIDPQNAMDEHSKLIDKKKRYIVLHKEITYVDIPLKKNLGATCVGKERVDAVASINVGVFLSPADIRRIVEKDTAEYEDPRGAKNPPVIKLLAVAMEAKYNEAACWLKDKNAKDEKEDFFRVESDTKPWLQGKWWKKDGTGTRGASLRSINETPFAAFYYPTYCATRPMYGSNAGSSASSPTSLTPSSALGDPAETTAADAAASDDTGTTGTTAEAGDTEPAPATPTSSGRKSRRSRSSR